MLRKITERNGALEWVVRGKEEVKISVRFFVWHNLFRSWRVTDDRRGQMITVVESNWVGGNARGG